MRLWRLQQAETKVNRLRAMKFHSFYDLSSEELHHLEQISKLDRSELQNRKRKVLLKCIRSKALVEALVERDLFLTEYAFLERAEEVQWLARSIDELLSLFRSVAETRRNEFVELLVTFRDDVSRAADNWAQIDMITPPALPVLPKAVVKLVFRDIGDFLEGSYQVFAKFVLACLRLSRHKDPEGVRGLSFGQCVSEIIESGRFNCLYKPEPWGILLSQWRNIANHNSFRFEHGDERIVCEYGSNVKNTIQLTPEELYSLKFDLGRAYNAHKITHSILFLEHLEYVVASGVTFTPRLETVVHQVREFTFSHGFIPKQEKPDTPLTALQFTSGVDGSPKYSVFNSGPLDNLDERAHSLARVIVATVGFESLQVEVYDQGEMIQFSCRV